MTNAGLEEQIARLESINDHLLTEIVFLNDLMRRIGFSEGIKTVKATAQEIIKQSYSNQYNDEYEDN